MTAQMLEETSGLELPSRQPLADQNKRFQQARQILAGVLRADVEHVLTVLVQPIPVEELRGHGQGAE